MNGTPSQEQTATEHVEGISKELVHRLYIGYAGKFSHDAVRKQRAIKKEVDQLTAQREQVSSGQARKRRRPLNETEQRESMSLIDARLASLFYLSIIDHLPESARMIFGSVSPEMRTFCVEYGGSFVWRIFHDTTEEAKLGQSKIERTLARSKSLPEDKARALHAGEVTSLPKYLLARDIAQHILSAPEKKATYHSVRSITQFVELASRISCDDPFIEQGIEYLIRLAKDNETKSSVAYLITSTIKRFAGKVRMVDPEFSIETTEKAVKLFDSIPDEPIQGADPEKALLMLMKYQKDPRTAGMLRRGHSIDMFLLLESHLYDFIRSGFSKNELLQVLQSLDFHKYNHNMLRLRGAIESAFEDHKTN